MASGSLNCILSILGAHLTTHAKKAVAADTDESIEILNGGSAGEFNQSNAILGTVPLLWYEQGLDVQSAVESTCEFLKTAVSISDDAVARILREYQDDASEYDALVAYIDVLRTNIKGNYYWSVRTRQYLIPGTLQKDESMAIVL
ncbi:hypothetical protein DL95DRAFT_407756 [Leptodontidium sp. 2 PMI_412]|nr:hypothetical protein DL95DRAFT_407756 [Leptodontidium sp. 2 PMI_412]